VSTLVFAPGCKVYIDSYKKGAILDVSDDLTGGGMQRRADGVSQFQFGLTNVRRKYDNVFTPNDRIVVVMKRLTWMRTFTGYLNQVPLFSSWPRDINLSASCSLKRLQYFYWDPYLSASQELVRDSLVLNADGSAPDGGIKQVVINLLEEVVDWSGAQAAKDKRLAGTKIHIGGIPKNWFDFAAKIAKSVAENVEQEAVLAAQLLSSLGAGATLSGSSISGKGNIATGTGGLTDSQLAVANQVLAVVFRRSPASTAVRDAELTIGCAMQESKLTNLPGGDRDSVGVFQQRPSQGWGTVAECQNIDHATNKWMDSLLGVRNRAQVPFTVAIQTVQRSGFPNAYAQWEPLAKAVVAAYLKSIPTTGGDPTFQGNFPGTTQGTGGTPSTTFNDRTGKTGTVYTGVTSPTSATTTAKGTTTAAQIVQTAVQVCQRPIPYQLGGDSAYNDPSPTRLDCSSFVQWVYYHSLGTINGMPRTAQGIYEWVVSNGKEISAADAGQIPGALLFVRNSAGKVHHIEISLGGGNRSIGAHHSGTICGATTYHEGYYNLGGLLPSVDYNYLPAGVISDGTAGELPATVAAALAHTGFTATNTDVQQNGGVIDSLFGNVPWENASQGDDGGLADSLVGIRALSNDQPILPYIANLMNATMRQFCSAPNGDFIGWFPDYYGIWGTAAKMVLQPIEVVDFTVDWSDEYLVTHQFVSPTNDGGQQIDLATGQLGIDQTIGILARTESTGIATIDQPGIMAALFGLDQTPDEAARFTKFIYDRFGPRPNFSQVPGVTGPKGEFFLALFMFMQGWVAQYNSNIQITFMPELFPGMLVQFPTYNFQAYVTQVEHSFSYGPGGGFQTRINIAAPCRIKDTGPNDKLAGLPIAGARGNVRPTAPKQVITNARSSTPPVTKTPVAVNPKLERLVD
jgi:cell wall-associated NlpC family hydrolase